MATGFGAGNDPLGSLGINGNTAEEIISNLIEDSALGGSLTSAQASSYFTGPRCIIRINGQLAGFAFNVSWTVNTEQKEVYTIDRTIPWEITPTKIAVSGSMSMFHIPGKGPSEQLIQSDVLSFMFFRYIQIEIQDSKTRQILFKTNKAVVTSRMQDVKSESISTIQLQWKAIGWSDELEAHELKYPIGISP